MGRRGVWHRSKRLHPRAAPHGTQRPAIAVLGRRLLRAWTPGCSPVQPGGSGRGAHRRRPRCVRHLRGALWCWSAAGRPGGVAVRESDRQAHERRRRQRRARWRDELNSGAQRGRSEGCHQITTPVFASRALVWAPSAYHNLIEFNILPICRTQKAECSCSYRARSKKSTFASSRSPAQRATPSATRA